MRETTHACVFFVWSGICAFASRVTCAHARVPSDVIRSGALVKPDQTALTRFFTASAAALIDRLVHHCHIVDIRGNSYRMRDHQNLLHSGQERRRKRTAA